MHLLCGYAPAYIDADEVGGWFNSGDIYRELEVKALAYDFYC